MKAVEGILLQRTRKLPFGDKVLSKASPDIEYVPPRREMTWNCYTLWLSESPSTCANSKKEGQKGKNSACFTVSCPDFVGGS